MRKRSLISAASVAFIGFFGIICRLFVHQVVNSGYLERMALEQQLTDTKLDAKRGTIFDRNMKLLAQSATAWTVALEPAYITEEKRDIICSGLAEILGIEKEKIKALANKKTYYAIVKKKIESDIKDRITEFKNANGIVSGILLVEDYKRYYPYGSFAAALLGFTGLDGQGLAGVEAYYEKELKGKHGRLVTSRNAIGTEMPYDYEQMIKPENGLNLRLCLDETIQRIVEKHLCKGVELNKVKNRGVALMMDVTNGEILAMAVKNDFDPNEPFKIINEEDEKYLNSLSPEKREKASGEILSKQWRNKAVSDTYYSGSVFKMVTVSMALDLGLIDDNWSYFCGGSIKINEKVRPINCWKHDGHGYQTFSQALCNSCNPAFILLGQKIGAKNFFDYYKGFGFHERSGIDLPGEACDLFFNKSGKMGITDLAVASIGQNFGITPIQMIVAAAAIANGGKLLRPHVVKEILDSNGNIVKSFGAEIRREVISKKVAEKVTAIMMHDVVAGGARNAYVPGFRIAGKTGTSEKIGLSTPGYMDYFSSFCGFAPADNPRVALLIFLDTPRGPYYYGSLIAAPIFAEIMKEVLPYLGIEPRYTKAEMEQYGVLTPKVCGEKICRAREILVNAGFKPIFVGKGENVIFQVPHGGEHTPKGSSVLIYTEEIKEETTKVPDFSGKTRAQSAELAKKAKLGFSSLGSRDEDALAVSQSLASGSSVVAGSTVEIIFVSYIEEE
jgi:stage V sporulation protein D (sporulation-specific penicillin-binding protein)